MDAFQLRNQIVQEYADYTKSFLTILDASIREFVYTTLDQGKLWPDALVQLSPAYEQASTVESLVGAGVLHPMCKDIFSARDGDGVSRSLRLYYHQLRAIQLAAQRKHYVVITGTGSGKSLTYIIPIIDHVLRHTPEQGKVRAIIVYPMNALINSQEDAIERFMKNVPEGQRTVSFARYTGQEDATRRSELRRNPPHILLTNYVMLELMLTRPEEFPFVDRSTAALQFVVLDELHTYRGRQGADVALLMRRLRERCGNSDLLCIGTSATMASGDVPSERQAAVAAVASTVFGTPISHEHVIEETLTRAVPQFNRPTNDDLRSALLQPLPPTLDWLSFQQHPLASWIESTFSLRIDQNGMLRRAKPKTMQHGADELAKRTNVPSDVCAAYLQDFFRLGSAVRDNHNAPGFAFKLHQFISQGSAVYATLEPPERRALTLEGQRVIGGPQGERLLFPLVFCRECGQHYALSIYHPDVPMVEPRQPLSRGEDIPEPSSPGYLLIGDDVWSEDDEDLLPDSWYRITRRGRTINRDFKAFVPRRLFVYPDGAISDVETDATTTCWFIPTPFLTCLHCGVVYTKRDKDDFRKLARLSSEGRSTATTLISVAAIDAMRHSTLKPEAQKLLSFTDNRQDASLQAGHFNDFAAVGVLRAAIALALASQPADEPFSHQNVAQRVFKALALPQEAYAKDVATYPGARRRNEEALTALLEYRIYEDLRRSWRVTQPNLEQCGLLRIDYQDLQELCEDDEPWTHSVLAACTSQQRETTIRVLLDYMRRELAVDAPWLDPDKQGERVRQVNAALNKIWAFDEQETALLRQATRFVMPSDAPTPPNARSFSVRSSLGRFLRSPLAWPVLTEKLDEDSYEQLLQALLAVLVGANLLTDIGDQPLQVVQLRHDALLWQRGDGALPRLDPVRGRRMARQINAQREPNQFFRHFYQTASESLRAVEGREHTGQVKQEDREDREQRFRRGTLPLLFCSPTMELGIDISDLNMVHMRNVPPTPANYAQRSGRAGRSGQAAFVVTYCSTSSGHDQYFFQRPGEMVAGVVAPPQIDLANEDLIRAHIYAIWLSFTGIDLTRSMINLVDASASPFPLMQTIRDQLHLAPAQMAACTTACERVLATCQPALQQTSWFDSAWLYETIDSATTAFDRACNRWRELYQAADDQLQLARQTIDQSHRKTMTRDEVIDARRRNDEALRQKDLLCNNTGRGQSESDFYPYRYLASEGFLPGYNFPRLPVRAFLRTDGDDGTFLARPRFLALTEFGPQNVIYHEGRKYRVVRSALGSDANRHFLRAKVCKVCGYFHDQIDADVCEHCGARFQTGSVEFFPHLFQMTTVTTQRIERITCEEEERLREGFRITTHYRFSRDQGRLRRLDAGITYADRPGFQLTYGPAATIWRINHGWRRSHQQGFTLNLAKGIWNKRPEDEGEVEPGTDSEQRLGVRIAVQDTRNLLLFQPSSELDLSEKQIISLQYALQRGIAEVFQLEEQELNSEVLGEGSLSRIMFWEAAEGGAGVLRRLVEEPDALARVARTALEICHIDPDTGDEIAERVGECVQACYRCLLSYANQPDHALLDRRAIGELLLGLAHTTVQRIGNESSTADTTISMTPAVERVLMYVQSQGGRTPNAIMPEIAGHQPHLFYAPSFCVLCPELGQSLQTMADDLIDEGYQVIVLRPDQELKPQLVRYSFWKQ